MKTALKETQANLTVTQSWAKSQVDHSRCDEMFEVGNEVVLSMCNFTLTNICHPNYGGNRLDLTESLR